MIKSLWAKLTGGMVVYLQDYDGEINTRIAYKNPFGGYIAKRNSYRHVNLHEDGTCSGCVYVEKWKFKE